MHNIKALQYGIGSYFINRKTTFFFFFVSSLLFLNFDQTVSKFTYRKPACYGHQSQSGFYVAEKLNDGVFVMDILEGRVYFAWLDFGNLCKQMGQYTNQGSKCCSEIWQYIETGDQVLSLDWVASLHPVPTKLLGLSTALSKCRSTWWVRDAGVAMVSATVVRIFLKVLHSP